MLSQHVFIFSCYHAAMMHTIIYICIYMYTYTSGQAMAGNSCEQTGFKLPCLSTSRNLIVGTAQYEPGVDKVIIHTKNGVRVHVDIAWDKVYTAGECT